MPFSSPLPDNLARLRKARDLSQEQLAEAAAVGVDTVGRIERGERLAVRPATLQKLAGALGVAPTALTGTVLLPGGVIGSSVGELRRAITGSASIPGLGDFAENREVVSLDELARGAHQAWSNYVGGRMDQLLNALPLLLVDARRLVEHSTDETSAVAQRHLSVCYRLGAGVAGRLDLNDLAWASAERALSAAALSDRPDLEKAVSLRYLVWVLIRQGRFAEADQVAIRAAESIEPRMLEQEPVRAGVFGNLLFNASAAALRTGRPDRAREYLTVARATAVRVGADVASEAAIFGPRVVGLQTVELAVRSGDPASALQLARALPEVQGSVPRFWEAGHRLHLAKAAADLHRNEDALHYLAKARSVAPDWAGRQPLGRSTMRILVDRAARRRGETFGQLATHYGAAG